MTPSLFKLAYLADAQASEAATKVPWAFTLGQAAVESAWGENAPQFNFFGIKADASWSGLKQLLLTHELLRTNNVQFPEVISITLQPGGLYLYRIKDWFRAYENAQEGFIDHGLFLTENSRYAAAFQLPAPIDPINFVKIIATQGYATGAGYCTLLCEVITEIGNIVRPINSDGTPAH